MRKYRAVWSPWPEGLGIKPYVVERKVRWLGWVHVTRIDDPSELGKVAAEDSLHHEGAVVREITIR